MSSQSTGSRHFQFSQLDPQHSPTHPHQTAAVQSGTSHLNSRQPHISEHQIYIHILPCTHTNTVQWNLDLSFFKGMEKTNDECGKTINPGNYYTLHITWCVQDLRSPNLLKKKTTLHKKLKMQSFLNVVTL